MENLIRITSSEEMQTVPYNNVDDITPSINGGFSGSAIPLLGFEYTFNGQDKSSSICVFCLSDCQEVGENEFKKINVFTALQGAVKTFGNIALLIDDDGYRGFSETETTEFFAFLKKLFEVSRTMIEKLHQKFDNECDRIDHFSSEDESSIF